jgi:hypothetical protein
MFPIGLQRSRDGLPASEGVQLDRYHHHLHGLEEFQSTLARHMTTALLERNWKPAPSWHARALRRKDQALTSKDSVYKTMTADFKTPSKSSKIASRDLTASGSTIGQFDCESECFNSFPTVCFFLIPAAFRKRHTLAKRKRANFSDLRSFALCVSESGVPDHLAVYFSADRSM